MLLKQLLSFHCRHRYASGFQLDLAFELDHRFTALFGPSGAGKSSTLAMIAGFLRPESGTIRLAGRPLLDTPSRLCLSPERRQIGFVFQDGLLFPHLTVEGNLRYGQRHRRTQRRPMDFARVVEVLEIGPLLARYPRNLSGGEAQRVALGRALLSGPELLVMDEPLAALDAVLRAKILAYLDRVVREWNIPTLFVTHSQADVRRAADWVVVIQAGRLVTAGVPDDALSRPEPLGWADSTAPVNLLRVEEVQQRDGHTSGRVGNQILFLPPGEIPPQRPLFVQFSPTDGILSREDIPGLSARNHLRGVVRQLVPSHQAVFVAVDIGQIIWLQITPEAAAELCLESGATVTCFLKTHSLRVVD
jgi:molybdate transport system ATP-binding protein